MPDGAPPGSGGPRRDHDATIARLESTLQAFAPRLFAGVSLAAFIDNATRIAVDAFSCAASRAGAAGDMMRELEQAIGEIAQSGSRVSGLMREAAEGTHKVNELVESHGAVVQGTVESAARTQDMAQKVAEASSRIQRFGQEIRSITDQTSMLSLNASIEAARAGIHGRGFGVVAQSVKELATQTRAASESVDAAASELVSLADGMKKEIAALSERLAELEADFAAVSGAATETRERVGDADDALAAIAAAVEEQNAVASSLHAELDSLVRGLDRSKARVGALAKVQNDL